jgi:hypothetical protein
MISPSCLLCPSLLLFPYFLLFARKARSQKQVCELEMHHESCDSQTSVSICIIKCACQNCRGWSWQDDSASKVLGLESSPVIHKKRPERLALIYNADTEDTETGSSASQLDLTCKPRVSVKDPVLQNKEDLEVANLGCELEETEKRESQFKTCFHQVVLWGFSWLWVDIGGASSL